jgi:hypothetical protein
VVIIVTNGVMSVVVKCVVVISKIFLFRHTAHSRISGSVIVALANVRVLLRADSKNVRVLRAKAVRCAGCRVLNPAVAWASGSKIFIIWAEICGILLRRSTIVETLSIFVDEFVVAKVGAALVLLERLTHSVLHLDAARPVGSVGHSHVAWGRIVPGLGHGVLACTFEVGATVLALFPKLLSLLGLVPLLLRPVVHRLTRPCVPGI